MLLLLAAVLSYLKAITIISISRLKYRRPNQKLVLKELFTGYSNLNLDLGQVSQTHGLSTKPSYCHY